MSVHKKPDETARKKGMERDARRPPLSPEERQRMIAEAAYYRAERRGFQGGSPQQDWYEAETEIESLLSRR